MVFVHQCNRPMFHFASRNALGVYIRHLGNFKRTLECDWVQGVAAQIKPVVKACQFDCQFIDLRFKPQTLIAISPNKGYIWYA